MQLMGTYQIVCGFILGQLGISVAEIESCQSGLLVTCEWALFLVSCYSPSSLITKMGSSFPLEKSLVTSKAPLNGETQFGQDDECGSDVVVSKSVWNILSTCVRIFS